MPSTWEPLGAVTVEITVPAGGAGVDFAGEFKNAFVLHSYEEIGESRTMLDGTERPATEKRTDGFKGDTENDLTAAGLYKLLYANDLAIADLEFTQVESGASWVGKIKLKLPSEVGADEFGAPIVSSIEWLGVPTFTFTPATVGP